MEGQTLIEGGNAHIEIEGCSPWWISIHKILTVSANFSALIILFAPCDSREGGLVHDSGNANHKVTTKSNMIGLAEIGVVSARKQICGWLETEGPGNG